MKLLNDLPMKYSESLKAHTFWTPVLIEMRENGDIAKMGLITFGIYLIIKTYTDYSTGEADPSIETIAKVAGLSKRQVIRSIKVLEEIGYLTKKRSGSGNVYTLWEKINIKDAKGNIKAVATWPSIPIDFKDALTEIKNIVLSGEMTDGKIINIAIHIDINQLNVAKDSTQIIINGADLANMPKDMQEKLLSIKKHINHTDK
jgi:hypothetical protein